MTIDDDAVERARASISGRADVKTFLTTCLTAFLITGTIAALSIPEPSINGVADRIIDGDTLQIQNKRIRLWGINAPELSTTDGMRARYKLAALTNNATILCIEKGVDKYERIVAQCFVDNNDIGGLMIATGHAKDWPRYSGGAYRDHEEAARSEKLGMWSLK